MKQILVVGKIGPAFRHSAEFQHAIPFEVRTVSKGPEPKILGRQFYVSSEAYPEVFRLTLTYIFDQLEDAREG